MDQSDAIFDVWSDEGSPFARMIIVESGAAVPSIFTSACLRKIGSSRVAGDISDEVRGKGFCSMRSNVPFDPKGVLGVSF